MKKYKTLIFDLDDTLIDNNESIRYAFSMVLKELSIDYTEELADKWIQFDREYWYSWESGKMIIPDYIKTIEEKRKYLRSNRFILFLESLNLDFDKASMINDLYCNTLGINIIEIEGANELLRKLNTNYEIVIATNGPKEAALSKIKKAKLAPFINKLITSEEIGYSKPMPEFFEYLFDKIKNKDKNTMLLIGDSLTTDVLGGMNNGIDTCWFNFKNELLPSKYTPTMMIDKLLDLLNIL